MNLKWLILGILFIQSLLWGGEERKMVTEYSTIKEKNMSKLEIEKLLKTYEEALNASDAKKAVALYTETGVFMPTQAPTAIGKTALIGAYEFVFKTIQLKIKFSIQEIVISGDMAYAVTLSEGTTLIHSNGQTVPESNRELFVFQKTDGHWKIARYMFNKSK